MLEELLNKAAEFYSDYKTQEEQGNDFNAYDRLLSCKHMIEEALFEVKTNLSKYQS